MTIDQARVAYAATIEHFVHNSASTAELRKLKEMIQLGELEDRLQYLVNNYSIEELRRVGINI